jgi:phospholipid/cholesterol/gamma-HCH transport system substrate-binding protein
MKVADRYSPEDARYIKIGLCVAITIIALIGCLIATGNKFEHDDTGNYYPIKATFGRTDGLLVGDKVRMSGLDIGRVTHAELDANFHAILTMEVKESVKIPEDSSASIVSSSIMGAKYIEIEPGGSEDFLSPNDDFTYTQDAMVLEELVGRIIDMGKASRSPEEIKDIKDFEKSVNLD